MGDGSISVLEPVSANRVVDNEAISGHPDAGGGSAFRQRVVISGDELAKVAAVSNAPMGPGDYALAVREIDNRYRITPFGEQRTANPYSLGDYVQRYGLDTNVMSSEVSGGGTVTSDTDTSSTLLTVATSGDAARQRTKRWHRYQPGHATMTRMTVALDAVGVDDRVARWGQFSDDDGVYFEHEEGTTSIVVRSSTSGSPVMTKVASSSWNVDPYDGTGPSGRTLTLTNIHVFEICYQWLGAGLVWWFIDGHLVHVSDHPGALSVPYMASATLPLTWEMISTGGAGWMRVVCSNVVSLGGSDPPFIPFGHALAAPVSVATAPGTPIFSIRAAALLGGRDNRVEIRPTFVSALNEGSRALVQAIMNPVLTGASWSAGPAGSAVEIDESATAFTGGSVIAQIPMASNAGETLDLSHVFTGQGEDALRIGTFSGDIADILTIVGIDAQAGTTDITAAIDWKEYR